jgi:quercetin dioxygenase-like cupin family protein
MRSKTMLRAGWLFVSLSILAAQQPADPNANFTGKVERLESNIHVRAARIHFEAGARTKWHIHERG